MRKPLLSRGAVVFVATCLVGLSAFTLSSREVNFFAARVPLVEDWSTHHMIFSKPANLWQAALAERDPRYWNQFYRQNGFGSPFRNRGPRAFGRNFFAPQPLGRDWAVSLGTTGAYTGDGHFPAKYNLNINATPSCAGDYVAYNTSLTGKLQMVGFNNLYSSQSGGIPAGICGTTGPTTMFAYDTRTFETDGVTADTTGTTSTSSVLSLDGAEVIYVETNTAGNKGALLKILRWSSGDGGTIGTPVKPTNTATLLSLCPAIASCLITVPFHPDGVTETTPQPDTNSSPYYDYAGDNLYVGDDDGVLHKFSGILTSTPTEVISAGHWPLVVHAGFALTSPVFVFGADNIYVGDSSATMWFVRDTGSTTGACTGVTTIPCLGSTSEALGGAYTIRDGPVVDPFSGHVFIFSSNTAAPEAAVTSTNLLLGGAVQDNFTASGGAPATSFTHLGAFDYTYLNSAPGAKAGHMYVCGKTDGHTNEVGLFRLSFTAAGALTGTPDGPGPLGADDVVFVTASGATVDCSAVSEITNAPGGAGSDYIFVAFNSTATDTTTTTCTTATQGCLMSLVVGTLAGSTETLLAAWPPAAMTAGISIPGGGTTAANGPSGIVIDNVGSGAQESSIYYSFNANATVTCDGTATVGCAAHATQNGLK